VRLVDEALLRQVDFIVIAGDLYDGAWRDVGTGLFFNRQISRLTTRGIGVVILHGNHDAESELRKLPSNPLVHTFASEQPGTLRLTELGVALHGQSFAQPAVTANLVDDYPEPERGVFNIGVLHTALEGHADHARYAPCTLRQLRARGYDYWALGHVHEHIVLSEDPWIVFPGNLQGRKINEPGPRGAVLVTVEDGRCRIERLLVDVLRWQVLEVDLGDVVSMDAAQAKLRAALAGVAAEADPALSFALRLRLHGATPVHGLLWGGERLLREDLLLMAAEFGAGRLLIEKLRIDTTPARAALPSADEADALADLRVYFERAADDPEFAALLHEDLERFLGSCPPEVREQVDLVRACQGERLGEVIRGLTPSLLARLGGGR
jgi:exonuclease SbcD